MRKVLTSALAALTFGAAVAATAAPAEADARGRHHRSYYRHHHHGGGDKAAIAVAAGIAGLALGAALSDGDGPRRSRGGYSYSYSGGYNNGYAYDPRYDGYYGDYYARGPRTCITRERVWDPYIGRHVTIERRYRC